MSATTSTVSGKLFSATCFVDLLKSLTMLYGQDKGNGIFSAAEKILAAELAIMNDRGNKMIKKHMRYNILPGYACYRAMLDSGIGNIESIEFIKGELVRGAERMARLSKRVGLRKHVFGFFRLFMKVVLNYGYPKQGWTIVMLEKSKERFRFDITSCLYYEELKKRGAQELCPAYCYTDVVSYAPLAPAILFKRQNTLAQMGDNCDFCFERGHR